jgi:hypothetical protein
MVTGKRMAAVLIFEACVIPAQADTSDREIQKEQHWIPGLRCAPPGMTGVFGSSKCHSCLNGNS